MTDRRILLVEDEPDIAELITLHLAVDDVQVHHVTDGLDGLALALAERWDLLLLDLSLPRCDGLDICEMIRRHNATLPIVIITARGTEQDRVRGLDLGADDYLAKPFGVAELVARVRGIFRRSDARGEADPIRNPLVRAGDIELSPEAHEVRVSGRTVELTPKEFDLLLRFCRAPERVFPRAELLREVWGYSHDGYLHTVNTHINRLRSKIEPDPATPRYITTVWGVGYKLCAETSGT